MIFVLKPRRPVTAVFSSCALDFSQCNSLITRIRVGLPWSRCGRCRWSEVSAGWCDRPRSRGARKTCTSRRLNSSSYRIAWTRCPSPVSSSTAVDCCRTARKTFGSAQYIVIRKQHPWKVSHNRPIANRHGAYRDKFQNSFQPDYLVLLYSAVSRKYTLQPVFFNRVKWN